MTPTTTTDRQAKRRQRLNKIAQALGFPSWGKMETAVLQGKVTIKIEKKEG